MTKIIRVGVTFPPELLEDFDRVLRKIGYKNRSRAIQDAVRLFISEKKNIFEDEEAKAGVLTLLYTHEVSRLEDTLVHIQHHFAKVITSTMHVHLSEKECLEAIVVKGKSKDIQRLSDELSSKKGVKIMKTTIISV